MIRWTKYSTGFEKKQENALTLRPCVINFRHHISHMNATAETITFRQRSYTVVQERAVTPVVAELNITRQLTVRGSRGAMSFLQIYQNGGMRMISTSGRSVDQLPGA